MRIFVGVHVSTGLPEGPAIQIATQVFRQPPWVLKAGPATHAFLAIHQDGLRLRLDGHPPRSSLSWDWHKSDASEARWELQDGNGVNLARVLEVAKAETGVPYDLAEALAQALPLPGAMKRAAYLPGHICTRVVTSCLTAAGADPAALVAGLPDLFPETLARALSAHQAKWLVRLPSVED